MGEQRDVAIIAPMEERVADDLKYAGIERVVYGLATTLSGRGHRVTLYASGGSAVPDGVEVVPCTEGPVRLMLEAADNDTRFALSMLGLEKAIKHIKQQQDRGREFDIIHNHFSRDYPVLQSLDLAGVRAPRVTTFHGLLSRVLPQTLFRRGKVYGDEPVVAISKSQQALMPDANYMGVVYNGVDTERLKFSDKKGEELVFIGRINPEKDPVGAINIAVATGRNLTIVAKVDPVDKDFHEAKVEPLIKRYGSLITMYGEANDDEKSEILAGRSLLAPGRWPEPFGLVYAEAGSCGSPAIGRREGAIPEIVIDGVTGIVEDTNKGIIRRIKSGELERISRLACRQHVETNFSYPIMTNGYLHVFDRVISEHI